MTLWVNSLSQAVEANEPDTKVKDQFQEPESFKSLMESMGHDV